VLVPSLSVRWLKSSFHRYKFFNYLFSLIFKRKRVKTHPHFRFAKVIKFLKVKKDYLKIMKKKLALSLSFL